MSILFTIPGNVIKSMVSDIYKSEIKTPEIDWGFLMFILISYSLDPIVLSFY